MDLIYTNAAHVDIGVLSAYAFDLSFGAKENDFEMTLGANEPTLEDGAFVYIDGTEYGGIVDGVKTSTDSETITYMGRTWHGMINSKVIQPDPGADYLTVTGEANEVLAELIARLGLEGLFAAVPETSGLTVSGFQFKRYCLGYDGIRDMLESNDAKLKMSWEGRKVWLSAVPIADYTKAPVDGDLATLDVERHGNKINHMVCLGRGDLAQREIIHLYVDRFGRIVDTPYYTGLNEIAAVYDNSNAESSEDLRKNGVEKLMELRDIDTADISISENEALVYDIGDIVGAQDVKSGQSVAAAVTQKIVKIDNGVIRTEYKTGS